MMADQPGFVDYYAILDISPQSDASVLEHAYRRLAKLYHPDHPETADTGRFGEVLEAYRALRDPAQRAQYDGHYAAETGYDFTSDEEPCGEEASAISDAEAHASILRFLYARRRAAAQDAGVGRYFVQQMLACSDEVFEFHLWYLKAKGLVETTEQGTLAITIEGVDHVIAVSQTTARQRLLTARS